MPVNLHYQVFGQGDPVIIMHGLFGSSRNWLSIGKKIAKEYKVYIVDLRNHGRSEHSDAMSYVDMAADISHFMEVCEIETASLIGHSMGGKVAMTYALQYRAQLDKLVILDISPVVYHNEFDLLTESLLNLPLEQVSSRNDADRILKDQIRDDGLRSFLLQNLVQEGGTYQWRVNLKGIQNNLDNIGGFPAPITINSLDCKALFLGGAESEYIQPHHHPIIRKFFAHSLIHRIDHAGHWLHIQQPEKVLDRITAFLRDDHSGDPPSLLYR